MASLPGWNSIETTGFLHDFFELGGIVLFLIVVAFELLGYFYGHRKDDLVAAEAQQIEQNHQAAEATRKAEVEGLQKRLTDAGKKVADLENRQLPRRLSGPQKNQLLAALTPFAGQKYSLSVVSSSSNEPGDLARDLVSVFDKAKWEIVGPVSYLMIAGVQPTGVALDVNPQEANDRAFRAALDALATGLLNMGLLRAPSVGSAGRPEAGSISIMIGLKPDPL